MRHDEPTESEDKEPQLESKITLFDDVDTTANDETTDPNTNKTEASQERFIPRALDPVKPINKWLAALNKLLPALQNYANRDTTKIITAEKKQEAQVWLDLLLRLQQEFADLLDQDGFVYAVHDEDQMIEQIKYFLTCCEKDENRLVLESVAVVPATKQAQLETIFLISNLSPAQDQMEEKISILNRLATINIFDEKIAKHFIVIKVNNASLRSDKIENLQSDYNRIIDIAATGGGGAISAVCPTLYAARQFVQYVRSGRFSVQQEDDNVITYMQDEHSPRLFFSQMSAVDARKPPVEYEKINNMAKSLWGLPGDIDELVFDTSYEADILIIEKNAVGNPAEGLQKHNLTQPESQVYAIYFANRPDELVRVVAGVLQVPITDTATDE